MKSQELSEFFSLIGQAKKEKEEEFDNLLKEANVDLDSMATSLFTGIENAKVEVKEQKKKEEKLIESLDSLLVSLDKPKETTPVVVGVPEDFDISSLEEEVEEEIVEEEVVEEETVEEDDTISKAIKFIDTQLKEELKDIEPNDPTVDSIKAEVKELRNILYKVLAHGPGSGEVRVLKMDDVDTDDLADGRVLSYDSSSEKLKFVDQSGGGAGYANTAGISTYAITAGIATNSTQLNGQAASYYLDYDNFTNTPTIPTNNNQLTNGAGYITTSFTNTNQLVNGAGFITNSVTGNFTVSGNVSIGGTLTYEDVTNIDSVGLITARSGVEVGSGTTLSPEGNGFFVGVVTATSFVGDVTGDLTGNADTATNAQGLTGTPNITVGTLTATTTNLNGNVTITSTDSGSSAAPELTLYRNSPSPAPGDYLGQLMFKGENSNGGQENYAKITGKITDETLGTEDGLIETAIKGNGSFTIVSRQRSDELQLINGCGLSVDGDITGNLVGDVTGNLNLSNGAVSSVTATTTTTSQTAVDTFAAATYRSVKYQIQITRGSEYHITEVFIVHDGTTSYGTEYATIKTGSSLASFDTDIDSGNVRLLATPTSSSSTVFKLVRTLIKV